MATPQPRTKRSRSRPAQIALFSIHSTVFLFLISLRILNAVSLRTFFQPDEYFQSLEPAWQLAFPDDGGAWITWEWHHQLRSILHPLLFAGLYRAVDGACRLFGIDPANALSAAPKVLMALFLAMGDWATARLAGRLWGSDVGWIALGVSLGSAWQWFAGPRTFANSLEAVVTAAALGLWPWDRRARRGEIRGALALAAVACVLRPTNVLVWACLGAFALWNSKGGRTLLIGQAAIIGTAVFGANALLDHTYYGEWTLPPVQFLRFNVLHSLSVFYGSNPWHYYLSQGLPLLLTSFLPVALFAIVAALRSRDPTNPAFQLAATSTAVIAVYSLISHKEVRFLHPLIPLLHPLVAKSIQDLPWPAKTRHRILALLVALNLPLAWYAGMVHQRGVVDVIHHLADTSADWSSAGFLMPCHSTPWCSTVGGRIPGSREMWALGCEPPVGLELEERNVYVDEADQFYADPVGWVRENLGGGDGKREWPERLVVFEALGEPWRAVMGYSECWRGWNSHWHDDWRRKGDVVVFCRDGA